MFEIFNKTEQLFLNSKPEPLYLLYTTAGESVIDKPDEKYKKLTVIVIGAGANGSGIGGDVTVGAPVEQRTFNGTTFGSGGGGTQGSGGGYPGLQGCVYIICE